MRYKICLLLLSWFLGLKVIAQDAFTPYFKRFWDLMRQRNSSLLNEYFVTAQDFNHIVELSLGAKLSEAVGEKDMTLSVSVSDTLYALLDKQGRELNIDWSDLKFVDFYYESSHSPEILLTCLRGYMKLTSAKGSFSLPVDEAIWIGNRWKIVKIGNLSFWSAEQTQVVDQKLTKYGLLDIKVELLSIEMEENPLPPPPPPPAPKKKAKSKQ